MRKNTKEVYKSWIYGASNRKQESIWTDGTKIYSYNTVLLETSHVPHTPVRFNVTKYSPTTSTHQNGLKQLLVGWYNLELVQEMDHVPIGSDFME